MHPTKNLLMALVAAVSLVPTAGAAPEVGDTHDPKKLRFTAVAGTLRINVSLSVPARLAAGEAFVLDRRDSSALGMRGSSPAAPATPLPFLPAPSSGQGASPEVSAASLLSNPFGILSSDSPNESPEASDSARSGDAGEEEAGPGKTGKAKRAADGGLDVPRINQITGGGRYPRAYCGPTSVRMVLAYFGIRISADEAAKGVYIRGKGASHEGMAKKLRSYGVKASLAHTRNLSSLRAAIDRGHPVIVNVRGNYGPRSTGGHIIVVVGFDKSGNPIINDPAGGGRHVCPKRKFLNAWNGLLIEASK